MTDPNQDYADRIRETSAKWRGTEPPTPPPPTREDCCERCRFFVRLNDADWDQKEGECHRNPPETDKGWPEVNHSDWCGEWQPVSVALFPEPSDWTPPDHYCGLCGADAVAYYGISNIPVCALHVTGPLAHDPGGVHARPE